MATKLIEVSTKDFENMTKFQKINFVVSYFKQNYRSQIFFNKDLKININVGVSGGRKTAYGEALYNGKLALIPYLKEIIENMKYNNFGQRKTKDVVEIIGYLNFKYKIKIDGKVENLRTAVQFQKGGKFYYNIEISKKNRSSMKPTK